MALSRTSKKAARRRPHVGIGLACYVEGTGIGPYEGAKVQVQSNGKVSVATGIGTQDKGTSRCSRKLRPISLVSPSRMSTS